MPPGGGHTIADIAEWYLGQRPTRLVPASREEPRPARRIPTEAVLAGHLGPDREPAVDVYARHRARTGECVGLLTAGSSGIRLRRVEPADRPAAPGTAHRPSGQWPVGRSSFAEDEGQPSWPQVPGVPADWAAPITAADSPFDRLLVASWCAGGGDDPDVLTIVPGVVVLVDASQAGQVAAYKAIKRYQGIIGTMPVGAFVVNAVDDADGAATGRRLAQLVRRFLGVRLEYAGCSQAEVGVRWLVEAQDTMPGARAGGPARWIEQLRDLVGTIGLKPTFENADSDGDPRTAGESIAVDDPWEIQFAVAVSEPVRTARQLRTLIESNPAAFSPDASVCKPIGTSGAADLLRVEGGCGDGALVVAAVGPCPGILETLLARAGRPEEPREVVWVGHPPSEEQCQAAERLGLRLRRIGLRHVCVDGHIGVLIESFAGNEPKSLF